MENPLRPVVSAWLSKIRLAVEHKQPFKDDAEEGMSFYNGPHDFFWSRDYKRRPFGSDEQDLPEPSFRMTVNKVAEMVQIFGPVLYHKNPIRQVNPRKLPMVPIELFGNPMDPMAMQRFLPMQQQVQQQRSVDKARSVIIEHYLNYTPTELGLKDEARYAIDEAIIKGMGCIWSEVYRAKSGLKMIGSFYDSVDNLQIDPDMESINDAQWIARRCVHPVWWVEREYGLTPGTLRGNLESAHSQAVSDIDPNEDYNRRRGMSNDLLTYWKIYSRMGLGARLSGVTEVVREKLDTYGDHTYLVVCEDVPWPLNLPPEVIELAMDEEIMQRIAWPTPFWADDAWPFTPIIFHPIPREVWPMSHLKPAMGEVKFLNWAYSFVAGKIRTACRDFIAISKSVGEEIKNRVLHGNDYELLEIERAHGTISEVIQFLQHPGFHGDIWKVVEAVQDNFEKRTGLNELMYGQTVHAFRSATESQVKAENLKIRPDDMASRVEDAMTEVSRKEALAARWHLEAQDVQPMLGDVGAYWWQQLIMSSDINAIVHQLEYRIEAGSAKKPNRDRDAANMHQALQVLLPILNGYATATGDVTALNNLLADWARSIDLDPEKYLLKPPPPMPMGAPSAPVPNGQPKQPMPVGR